MDDNLLFQRMDKAVNDLGRISKALEDIAEHLKGLRTEGIVVWGGVEPEAN